MPNWPTGSRIGRVGLFRCSRALEHAELRGDWGVMTWYTAHLVTWFRFKEGPQQYFPVQENLVLIEAASPDEARAKALAKGREYEGDSDGSLRCDDRPATLVFGGIRRLIECDDSDQRPRDCTEVSYQDFVLETHADLQRMIAGEEVRGATIGD